jgi:hypothetical protein
MQVVATVHTTEFVEVEAENQMNLMSTVLVQSLGKVK